MTLSLRDHLLRRHVQRDRPQVDPDHLVDERDQQDQAGALLGDQPAEAEDHAALVLAQDPDRRGEEDQQQDRDDGDDRDGDCHVAAPCSLASTSASGRTRSVSPSTASTRTLAPRSRTRSASASARVVGQRRPPERAVDEDLSHRVERLAHVAASRRPAPRRRSGPARRGPATALPTANARPPPSSTATTITTGAETSNESEWVSNSSRPETASAITPTDAEQPVGRQVGLGDDQREPEDEQRDPDRGHRQLRGAVGAEQEARPRRAGRG